MNIFFFISLSFSTLNVYNISSLEEGQDLKIHITFKQSVFHMMIIQKNYGFFAKGFRQQNLNQYRRISYSLIKPDSDSYTGNDTSITYTFPFGEFNYAMNHYNFYKILTEDDRLKLFNNSIIIIQQHNNISVIIEVSNNKYISSSKDLNCQYYNINLMNIQCQTYPCPNQFKIFNNVNAFCVRKSCYQNNCSSNKYCPFGNYKQFDCMNGFKPTKCRCIKCSDQDDCIYCTNQKCKSCIYNSNNQLICTSCKPGFNLINNTCIDEQIIQKCSQPQGIIQIQQKCYNIKKFNIEIIQYDTKVEFIFKFYENVNISKNYLDFLNVQNSYKKLIFYKKFSNNSIICQKKYITKNQKFYFDQKIILYKTYSFYPQHQYVNLDFKIDSLYNQSVVLSQSAKIIKAITFISKSISIIGIISLLVKLIQTLTVFNLYSSVQGIPSFLRFILFIFCTSQSIPFVDFQFGDVISKFYKKQFDITAKDQITEGGRYFINIFDSILIFVVNIIILILIKFLKIFILCLNLKKVPKIIQNLFILSLIKWKQILIMVIFGEIGQLAFNLFVQLRTMYVMQNLYIADITFGIIILGFLLFALFVILMDFFNHQLLQDSYFIFNKMYQLRFFYFISLIRMVGIAILLGFLYYPDDQMISCLVLNILYLIILIYLKTYFKKNYFFIYYMLRQLLFLLFQITLLIFYYIKKMQYMFSVIGLTFFYLSLALQSIIILISLILFIKEFIKQIFLPDNQDIFIIKHNQQNKLNKGFINQNKQVRMNKKKSLMINFFNQNKAKQSLQRLSWKNQQIQLEKQQKQQNIFNLQQKIKKKKVNYTILSANLKSDHSLQSIMKKTSNKLKIKTNIQTDYQTKNKFNYL